MKGCTQIRLVFDEDIEQFMQMLREFGRLLKIAESLNIDVEKCYNIDIWDEYYDPKYLEFNMLLNFWATRWLRMEEVDEYGREKCEELPE